MIPEEYVTEETEKTLEVLGDAGIKTFSNVTSDSTDPRPIYYDINHLM